MANIPRNSAELNFFSCSLNVYRFRNAKQFCASKLNIPCLCLDEYYLVMSLLCPFSILRFKTKISSCLLLGNVTEFSFCVARICWLFKALYNFTNYFKRFLEIVFSLCLVLPEGKYACEWEETGKAESSVQNWYGSKHGALEWSIIYVKETLFWKRM